MIALRWRIDGRAWHGQIGCLRRRTHRGGGTAATVVGAPASRGRSGISTAKVIGLVGTLVVAFLTYVGLTVDALSGMRQKLAGHEPYPRGSWPRSTTTNLEDGSLRDGDGTDWWMKY